MIKRVAWSNIKPRERSLWTTSTTN